MNRAAQPWYAAGARQLLLDRRAGVMPDRPVSVVLTGNTEAAPALYVRPDMPLDRMDWRMLVNLEVWVWASPAVALERVVRVTRDIAAARPKRLVLRFEASGQIHDIEVGMGWHHNGCEAAGIAPVHEFDWTPFNFAMTRLGSRLKRVLLAELPMWSRL